MELKGSKTEKNLMTAFSGESQARNKYHFFASVARKEGFEQIAEIFDETAGNDDLLKTPLFERLKYLGRRRIQYSQMLCYLNEKYGLPNINEVQFGLQVASQNWSITRSMLIKMYYTQEWKASRLKVADKIRDNAAYEQSLIMKLQNTIK